MKLLVRILLSKTHDVFLDLRPVEDPIKSVVFVSPFVVGLSVCLSFHQFGMFPQK